MSRKLSFQKHSVSFQKFSIAAFVAMMSVTFVIPAGAQRRITPLGSTSKELQGRNETKAQGDSVDISLLPSYTDETGRKIYVDTVSGREIPDTIGNSQQSSIPKMKQPLLYAAEIGVDLWDPVMRAFGQKYGITEISAGLNLHNRYIPVVEVGLGEASYRPDDNNYTYKVSPTPYFRIGCNYNFLYNSNPDYMVYAGLRLGWSRFSYSVDNVSLVSDYWGETAIFSVPRQTASVSYMQVLFGLRVKIAGPVSMGWALRYKAKLRESKTEFGEPWYIPGYGTRTSPVSGSFTVTYRFSLERKKSEPTAVVEGLDIE